MPASHGVGQGGGCRTDTADECVHQLDEPPVLLAEERTYELDEPTPRAFLLLPARRPRAEVTIAADDDVPVDGDRGRPLANP